MQILFLISLIIAVVSCQSVAIYNPTEGALFQANENVKFEWGFINDFKQERMQIDLVYGDANNARFETTIVKDLPGTNTLFDWVVTPSLTPREDYFLKFHHVLAGGARAYSYSGRFKITGTSGTGSPSSGSGSTGSGTSSSDASKVAMGSFGATVVAAVFYAVL